MKHLENIQQLFSKNFVENPLIESFDCGEIYLSSGKLLACDPLLTNDMQPFDVLFPKGNFPVIVHQEKENHQIAYVEIVFSNENCISWQMGMTKDQDIQVLKKNEIYGFPVASGMAAFMDEETQSDLNHLEHQLFLAKGDEFLGIFEEFFQEAFFEKDNLVKSYALVKPDLEKQNNIFAFDTGESEGFYASYIGMDTNGKPVKIVMELIEIGTT
jgi:hypothetical protein